MPIYAYRCAACGHAKDVLQKLSDPLLSVCPACGAASFTKQVTAAGFQLKGSGWYVTDFRNGQSPAPKSDSGAGAAVPPVPTTATPGSDATPAAASSTASSEAPAKSAAAPVPAASGSSTSGSASGQ